MGLGEHPSVTDEDNALKGESLTQLFDLVGDRRRVAGIARIYLDSHRATLCIGHGAVNDDQLAFLLITPIAKPGQMALPPFVVAA